VEISARELVDGMIARDSESWRTFLTAIGPIVRGLCRRSDLSDDEAEDIAQSLAVKLLDQDCKALRQVSVESDDRFFGWIKVVASRVVIDYVRHSSVIHGRDIQFGEGRWEEIMSADGTGEIERRVMLEEAAKKLTGEEQTLFQLEYGGLKDKEIARILGIELLATQQRLSRLRKKLKGILAGETGEA
jgi:RNA polymerase sigma factor (sigma-70 family)